MSLFDVLGGTSGAVSAASGLGGVVGGAIGGSVGSAISQASSLGQTIYKEVIATLFPRTMAGMTFDCVISEKHTLELAVTDNPIESGVSVTDHSYMKPYALEIDAGVTNSPMPWRLFTDSYGFGEARTKQAFEQLEALMRTREPFDVQTGLKLYTNMICTRVETTQDKTSANVFRFTATLREVIIVSTQTIEYPPREKGKTANQANQKKSSGEKQSKSIGNVPRKNTSTRATGSTRTTSTRTTVNTTASSTAQATASTRTSVAKSVLNAIGK